MRDSLNAYGVIMAGGGGTRFWPESRLRRPKQLLALDGNQTLIRQTADRLEQAIPAQRVFVITAAELVPSVGAELPEIPSENILGEPCSRDTAPCIGLAATMIREKDPAATMFVLPSDHLIRPAAEFHRSLCAAVALVDEEPEALVTFGVKPRYAATALGYIQRGAALPARDGIACYRVASFREKPEEALAQEFVSRGDYYWNCGIFAWRADRILELLQSHAPEIHERLTRIQRSLDPAARQDALAKEFPEMPRISIDHAVMEKARTLRVLEAPFQWDDVGNWEALGAIHGTDADGNTISATHCGLNTKSCIIRGQPETLIATLGLSDVIVVQTPDAILVANRRDQPSLKRLNALLREQGFSAYL